LVKPDDSIFFLGDFSMVFRPVEAITPCLNGIKYFMAGNHDHCHPYNKASKTPEKLADMRAKYASFGWEVIPACEALLETSEGLLKISHLPYTNLSGGAYDDKFEAYRPIDDGTPLLCGHVHTSWQMQLSSLNTPMLNVGVDVHNLSPISLQQVKEFFKTKVF
jgi:calcineurin-like phosphoesterase family protein